MPRYAARHRAPGRHKAKQGLLATSPPWAKTFAAVTGASLGVTGIIGGGTYLAGALPGAANDGTTVNASQNGAALAARVIDFSDRERDADRADRSTRDTDKTATPATPTRTPEDDGPDQLLTASGEGVIDRSAAVERREAEAEQRRREMLASADPKDIARALVGDYGWGSDQFSCLDSLWERESGWSTTAANPSGAYGIPQALPGSKMAEFGSDWRYNPRTQIEWGLSYIAGRYGSPCGAWAHSENVGWY